MVELESVLHRVLELLPRDAVSEDTLLEWAYQAFEKLAPREAYEIHTCLREVSNHHAELPFPLYSLELVMYHRPSTYVEGNTYQDGTPCGKNGWIRSYETANTTTECETSTDINTGCTSETTTTTTLVTKSCNKLNKNHDYAVYKSVDGEIIKVQLNDYTSPFQSVHWQPLQPSSNSFMKGLLIGVSSDLYVGCQHTFTIRKGCIMTSFSEGLIAIAYTGLPTNEQGQYTIPDYEYISEAIECYLKKKYWEWRMNLKEEGAANMYGQYAKEFEILAAKATAQLMMPTLMEYQRLRNMNKFINETSPYAAGTGASNARERLFFNNRYTGRLWL